MARSDELLSAFGDVSCVINPRVVPALEFDLQNGEHLFEAADSVRHAEELELPLVLLIGESFLDADPPAPVLFERDLLELGLFPQTRLEIPIAAGHKDPVLASNSSLLEMSVEVLKSLLKSDVAVSSFDHLLSDSAQLSAEGRDLGVDGRFDVGMEGVIVGQDFLILDVENHDGKLDYLLALERLAATFLDALSLEIEDQNVIQEALL
jgi:hypothetical protein